MANPSPALRQLIRRRAGDLCEVCQQVGSQIHHRRPRGAGGSRRADTNTAPNLILLCLSCHARIESYRSWAYEHGLLLRQHCDPTIVPVKLCGGWVLLTPEGSYRDTGAP